MISPAEHLEREVKLGADLDLALPDLRGLIGTERLAELELQASYFDTSDLRLWARGITFRHRVGEGPTGGLWTMKLPTAGAADTLDRTELTWPGTREQIPPEAKRILRGLVRHEELGQVVDLSTTRRRLALRDSTGAALGELDDDTVVVSGGPLDGLRFRQLELELASEVDGSGQIGMVDAVVGELRKAGARPGDGSKLAIALGLSPGTAESETEAIGRRSSLAEVVRRSIRDALHGLLDHDYRLRLDPSKPAPHDVHQARVATRRLRSDLKTLAPVLDPVWLEHTRGELGWLGGLLGEVRDADVLLSLFDAQESTLDTNGHHELLLEVREQRLLACGILRTALDSDRYLHLLERLVAAAALPPFFVRPRVQGKNQPFDPRQPAAKALRRLVRVPSQSLRRRVKRAGKRPSDSQLHKIRIGAKQLRYAAELASPVMGKPARRTASAAEHLQTVLGAHHDAVSAETWLRQESNRSSTRSSFAAGQLVETQTQRQKELRRQWRAVWGRLRRRTVDHWR
jgi:CHAD domain-containing protein